MDKAAANLRFAAPKNSSLRWFDHQQCGFNHLTWDNRRFNSEATKKCGWIGWIRKIHRSKTEPINNQHISTQPTKVYPTSKPPVWKRTSAEPHTIIPNLCTDGPRKPYRSGRGACVSSTVARTMSQLKVKSPRLIIAIRYTYDFPYLKPEMTWKKAGFGLRCLPSGNLT